ncbi:hypothetical protein V1508DRAFT_428644 [Lipomyces doorenjongii]|uniref:uncharacterized protein n=1 Tax=Lipomyces doorenjongii TaxID=383834 RepID=UPI0034CEE8F2
MPRGLQSRERLSTSQQAALMSVTDSEVLSNYNKAFTLLKENTPEQRLDVQLPYEKFLQLDKAKSAEGISEDQRYPSLAYNSFTETVTAVTCPIVRYVEDYLSTRSPDTLPHILQCGSTTQSFGRGGYNRSRKEPDGGFIYKPTVGTGKLMIAIEVGTSDTYGKVLEDKDMWINGKGSLHDSEILIRDTRISRSLAETVETNITLGYYGPLEYRGHTWVGGLNEAFIEVWRQGSHDTFELIQDGFALAHDDLPVTLNLKISDFYPHYAWQAANIEDDIIPFDSRTFLNSVMNRMGLVAQDRLEYTSTRNCGH